MFNLLAKMFSTASLQQRHTPDSPRWDPPYHWHSGGRNDHRFASKLNKHKGFW